MLNNQVPHTDIDSSLKMDSEASQVSAVSQVPTGSAQPAAANSATSRLQAKPERTTEHARAVHQLKSPDSKEAGMRRPFVTRGNSKDKPLSKLERKMDSDASQVAAVSRVPTRFARPAATNSGRSICQPELEDRKRGLRRLFQTKLNINGKSDPKLGNKVNMDLDENSRSGKVKKSKTKMDTTKDDERDPLPGAKVHRVYLTSDPLEDDEAALAYHKNFLENVFGSRASEIVIAYSCAGRIVNSFLVWLTDEQAAVLSGLSLSLSAHACTRSRARLCLHVLSKLLYLFSGCKEIHDVEYTPASFIM